MLAYPIESDPGLLLTASRKLKGTMRRIAGAALLLAPLIVCLLLAFPLTILLISGLVGSVMGDAYVAVGGVIQDEGGAPIAGATVSLSSASEVDLHAQATSSDDGRFSVGVSFGGGDARRVYEAGFIFRVQKQGFLPVERRVVEDGELRIVLKRRAEIPWFLKRAPMSTSSRIP